MKKRLQIFVPILLLLLMTESLQAQWNFNLSYEQEYNDNPFHLPEAEKSIISLIQAGVEKDFSLLSVGYFGAYSHFNELLNRNFYWHQLNVSGGSDTTSWGIFAEQRLNKDEFNIYNYREYDAYLRHRFSIAGIMTNWSGKIQYNSFDQLSELNNWKMTTGLSLHKSFSTKTTLITGLNISYKNYINTSQSFEMTADTSFGLLKTNILEIQTVAGNGNGGNGNKGNGGNNSGNGMGYNMDRGNGFMSPVSYVNAQNSSASQVELWVRIAQAVTPTTGIAAQYFNRTMISGTDRYVSGLSDSYTQESEIFNDPMGFESHSIGLDVTQLLPFDIILKLSAYQVSKDYSAQGIYVDGETYDETDLRKDDYRTAYMTIKKNMETKLLGGSLITLSLIYQWIENDSNSYWYKYNNQYGSIGLEIQL